MRDIALLFAPATWRSVVESESIAEGRAAAAAVDAYLSGSSALPAPIRPDTVALAAR